MVKSHLNLKFLSVTFLLFLSLGLRADELRKETEARIVAENFYKGKSKTLKRSVLDLRLYRALNNGYIYVPSGGEGFVCVAEAKGEPVVCGYSMTTDVRNVSVPSTLNDFLSAGMVTTDEHDEITEPIEPLLSSVWDQVAPYNGMCPYYKYDDGRISKTRCKVGCVATATSEVLRYYEWPTALQDTLHGWSTDHYELTDVLPGTKIDWSNILDTYSGDYSEQEAKAVQELALYCGMACRMNYGVNASGSNTFKMIQPLHDVFDYKYVTLYDRAYYSPRKWRELLQYELRRGVPLIYVGYNVAFAGHAFVVDGLDDSGFYHIRWGEGGNFNGYFNIDFMNAYEPYNKPTEMGKEMGHFSNQSVLAVHPDSLEVFSGDTLTYNAEDVVVEDFAFLRTPNTNGYVTAEMNVTNHSNDTITYTMLAFTTMDKEEIDWEKAEGVGITTVTLYPQTTTRARVHCVFAKVGNVRFGLTADEEHLLYSSEIDVEAADKSSLSFSSVGILDTGEHHAKFEVGVSNSPEGGAVSDIITYCFAPKGDDKYESQWTMFTLESGETLKDTISFYGLLPETEYTLLVRYPWAVVASCDVKTSASTSVGSDVTTTERDEYMLLTLQGVCLGKIKKAGLQKTLDGLHLPVGIYLLVGENGEMRKIFNNAR